MRKELAIPPTKAEAALIDRMNAEAKVVRTKRGIDFLTNLIDWIMRFSIEAYEIDRGISLDFSTESLQSIDYKNVSEINRDTGVRRMYNPIMELGWEGGYLGEVIVRNIGGKWIYPSEKKIEFYRRLWFLWMPSRFTVGILLKSCEVKLGDVTIPVMKIADLKLNKRSWKVRSLYYPYKRIEETGGREWELPYRCPECGKKAKGYKYCRKCGMQIW